MAQVDFVCEVPQHAQSVSQTASGLVCGVVDTIIDGVHIPVHTYVDDIYIHGRALAGMWALGSAYTIHRLGMQGMCSYRRVHGYSFGALAAVFMVCGLDLSCAFRVYERANALVGGNSRRMIAALPSLIEPELPPDAYRLCSDRVYIGYTTLPMLRYREQCKFTSNHDLVECLVSSCRIPGITAPLSDVGHRKLDGGIGYMAWGWGQPSARHAAEDTTPVVGVRSHVERLELTCPWIGYGYILAATDPGIVSAVLRGCIETLDFMSSRRPCTNIDYHPRFDR